MSFFGKPNIEKLKLKKDIQGLIKLLNNDDICLQKDAITALVELGNDKAFDGVIFCLFDTNREIRLYTANNLNRVNFKPRNTFEEILLIIAKREWDAFDKITSDSLLSSFDYFDKLFDKKEYKIFSRNILNFGAELHLIVAQILFERRTSIADILIEKINNKIITSNYIIFLGLTGDQKAIKPLINLLNYQLDAPMLFESITLSLKFLLIKNGIEEFITALKDKSISEDFILHSAWILPACGKAAIDGLYDLIKNDERASIRALSLLALVSTGDSETVKSLIKFINDSDKRVKDDAYAMLPLIENPALNSYITLARQGNEPYRMIASAALSNFNDENSINFLKYLIDTDKNAGITHNALFSLSKMIKENSELKDYFIENLQSKYSFVTRFNFGVLLIYNGINILNEL